ncbi:MAG: hypothetical protein PF690_13340 [Deltaproteobacteria bacterium]|nr:hypothetical protein [Deltaproteobacteria bacterium]
MCNSLSTPDAWALPGGKIATNRGLLTELHSESEPAAFQDSIEISLVSVEIIE